MMKHPHVKRMTRFGLTLTGAVLLIVSQGCNGISKKNLPGQVGDPPAGTRVQGNDFVDVSARGLVEFRKIAAIVDKADFGLVRPSDIASARLGDILAPDPARSEPPIPVFLVLKDELAQFTSAGRDVPSLLGDTVQFVYPVMVGEYVRGCLLIDRLRDGSYAVAAYGGRNFAERVVAARRIASAALSRDKDRFILVNIPALNRSLIATRNGPNLVIGPNAMDPNDQYPPDTTGKQTFDELAIEALAHNGNPR